MMHKMDNLNISDYYVSLEFLSGFPDNNINKWIESGNSEKIKSKLSKLYQYGGSFSSNHYQVTSTAPVQMPFLYKKNEKYFIEFTDTRLIHFFPMLNDNIPNVPEVLDEPFSDNLDKIFDKIINFEDTSKPNNKRKSPEEIVNEDEKSETTPPNKKIKIDVNNKPENILKVDLDCQQPEITGSVLINESKTKVKKKSTKLNECISNGDNSTAIIIKPEDEKTKSEIHFIVPEIPQINQTITDSSTKKKKSKKKKKHSETEVSTNTESIGINYIDRSISNGISLLAGPDQLAVIQIDNHKKKKNKKSSSQPEIIAKPEMNLESQEPIKSQEIPTKAKKHKKKSKINETVERPEGVH